MKCNRERPCDNCVQAQTGNDISFEGLEYIPILTVGQQFLVCVPSERLQRRSLVNTQ